MQTAIEYIFEQLEEQGLIFLTTKTNEMTISISASDYLDIKRLAKEMEKQQIINAINDVSENNVKYANKILSSLSGIQGELFMHNDKLAKQYYNETYGSKDIEKSEKPINLTSSQTEISDEEIEKEADNTYVKYNAYAIEGFIDGAKWYREQLKNKQNV